MLSLQESFYDHIHHYLLIISSRIDMSEHAESERFQRDEERERER